MAKRLHRLAVRAAAEALWGTEAMLSWAQDVAWPARCAVCDAPGTVLCDRCRANLPYIDSLRACPTCGAAWGRNLCTQCNSLMLQRRGLPAFPLDGCVSVLRAADDALRIVRVYKDRKERRLAPVVADLLANALPHSWRGGMLIPIPTREDALRRRGFDHMDEVCQLVAGLAGLPSLHALFANRIRDQRNLGARERQKNMKGAFEVLPEAKEKLAGQSIVLIDDVYTTGTTLASAAEVLRASGANEVRALTLLRV